MPQTDQKPERRVSIFISVRVNSLTASEAQAIEDKIRDVADDVPGSDVQASRGAELPSAKLG